MDAIQSHPFMLGETPMSLPISALTSQPVFKKSELYNPTAPLTSHVSRLTTCKEEDKLFIRPDVKPWADKMDVLGDKENVSNNVPLANVNANANDAASKGMSAAARIASPAKNGMA